MLASDVTNNSDEDFFYTSAGEMGNTRNNILQNYFKVKSLKNHGGY